MSYNINELSKLINESISSYFPEPSKYSEVLNESEIYTISSGGKRIRPVILLSVVDSLNGDVEAALPFAIALEMVHTYSLIHDDLPSMDNDGFRRGKPSNHVVYGEDIAILAGDGLLTLAFSIMSKDILSNPTVGKAKAMHTIANCAYKMVEGQVADIKCLDPDVNDYNFIIENKTGALFNAAVLAGVYLSSYDEEILSHLETFSDYLGKAFQIADDINDFQSEESVNFAKTFGLKEAIKELYKLTNNAENELNCLGLESNLYIILKQIKESING